MISQHEQLTSPYQQQDWADANTPDYLREENEAFYLANRTFYTTCHKISRQNSPSYRKKPPYTLLENWLIHSVFSKSQQILLRFPVIHPRVMMTEGDFIYTPHQMSNEPQHATKQEEETDYFQEDFDYGDEDDYDYYDDTFVIGDEGVMMMSASAPNHTKLTSDDDDDQKEDAFETSHSMLMDENMWMGHGRHSNTTGGLTLHVANPDLNTEEEEEEDPMYHHVTSGQTSYKSNRMRHSQLQIVQEEEEEEEEETGHQAVSLSPEVLHWYRSADLRQKDGHALSRQSSHSSIESDNSSNSSSTTDDGSQQKEPDEEHQTSSMSRTSSASSYQSLADMMTEDLIVSEDERCHERAMTASTYGTLLPASEQDRSMAKGGSMTQDAISPPIVQVSSCLVDAAWIALDLAQDYMDNERDKGVTGFMGCVLKIWKVLFSGAETMLVWRSYRMIRPQAIV
ncbi:hypothetical protein EDC96DRAFT_520116 [Choanephora cucurbitarum]|nr:hypothetical protein EDC96DRAFT_520116 [Choanephora cucurbitarum]